jgi:hypothetical protein
MPTTLPEVIAWSTGATWPIDGEPATIESVASQVQELKELSGTATVSNLYADNIDWAHLQVWRPVS